MKKIPVIFSALVLLIAFSCKTKEESKIKFTGITQVDKFGTVVGTPDSTDWGSKDKWSDKEKKLFTDSFKSDCANEGKYRVMFYPNPCRSKSTIYAIKDSTVRLSIRLVDKDFDVIMRNDSIYASALSVDMSSFKSNDTLRLYYKFITKDRCEYRGHGDILVQPYK